MNLAANHYSRALKRYLKCGRVTRQELLGQFHASLTHFLEDCPNPDYEQLVDAFGPPEEMAVVLMENVSKADRALYRKQQSFCKSIIALVVVLFIAYTIYTFFYKEYSVVVIYDELIPIQTK